MTKGLLKIKALFKKGKPFQDQYGKPILKFFSSYDKTFLLLSKNGDWAGSCYRSDMNDISGFGAGGRYNCRALDAVFFFKEAGLITNSEYDEFKNWWMQEEKEYVRANELKKANEIACKHGYILARKLNG